MLNNPLRRSVVLTFSRFLLPTAAVTAGEELWLQTWDGYRSSAARPVLLSGRGGGGITRPLASCSLGRAPRAPEQQEEHPLGP